MNTKFECDFCKQIYDTESEALDCEQTHSKKIPCQHIGGKNIVDAVCEVLEKVDSTELTFIWQRGSREVRQKFTFNNISVVVDDPGGTESEEE